MESHLPIQKIEKMGHAYWVKAGGSYYHGRPFWDAVAQDQWEVETFRTVKKFCSANDSFIDLGAWVGPITLFSACIAMHVCIFQMVSR